MTWAVRLTSLPSGDSTSEPSPSRVVCERDKGNALAMSTEMVHSRGSSVNVENLALLDTEFDETLAHIDGTLLDLDEVEPLVLRELEELPLLLLDGLLATDGLLDVLFLLDGIDDVTPAEGIACAVLAGVVEEDIGDGVDAGLGPLDEGVSVERVAADGAMGIIVCGL